MEKISCRLFGGDRSTLQRFYPRAGYNQVIRALVHKHCRQLEENLNQELAKIKLTPTELEE